MLWTSASRERSRPAWANKVSVRIVAFNSYTPVLLIMFWKIIAKGGLKLYDKYHNIVVNAIMENPLWQEEAGKHFESQFNAWWSLMNGNDVDGITAVLSEGIQNLQLPVFTRWHTIIPLIKLFIKNYVVIYFFALAVIQEEKSGSYLHNCACGFVW